MADKQYLIDKLLQEEQGGAELDQYINAFQSLTGGLRFNVPRYTTSTDAALDFMRQNVSPMIHIVTLTSDDIIASSADIWVYPNGLLGPGEFLSRGIHYDFPIAICIATLRMLIELDKK